MSLVVSGARPVPLTTRRSMPQIGAAVSAAMAVCAAVTAALAVGVAVAVGRWRHGIRLALGHVGQGRGLLALPFLDTAQNPLGVSLQMGPVDPAVGAQVGQFR